MSGRSSGLIGAWAETQRQQQRQREAELRTERRRQREELRRQRNHERDTARMQRGRQAEYRLRCEADARRFTEELDVRVESLSGLLAAGCRAPAFRVASLLREEPVGHRPDYDRHSAARLSEIRAHNARVAELTGALRDGDPATVVDYFSAALYASSGWPDGFPRQVAAAFDPAVRQLVLNWELPAYEVVPTARLVRYFVGSDQQREIPRPVGQRRSLYRSVLAQCVLLALRDLFAADEFGILSAVALNGFVDDFDPATGLRADIVLATVMVEAEAFARLRLESVSPVDCLVDGLHGRLSVRPDQRMAVPPGRLPERVGSGVVARGGEEEPDLLEMDPAEFEALVADLFRARGLQAVTTQRSHDGGVDVDAVDPDPISGGKIVVQVKRYRNTVPPSAVRDLFGTVQGAGANKGVLVTTSGFGPGSYTFANGKPLTLVPGSDLVDLLHRCGMRGRLGGVEGAAVPRSGAGAGAGTEPNGESGDGTGDHNGGDYNVVGMSWTGRVALDMCALVCRGSRVLSDSHFVFYNNVRTPEGSVRMLGGFAGDRAAVRVAFDELPVAADRLVLVAAVDPEADPEADLAGFTGAGVRLRGADGAELDQVAVSDGRPGETALVLGSFRRRSSGDWSFVVGGKGYAGGLEELVREFGIDVE
ncbi:restriction endonuclease [Streptomyces sp. NPDC046465]|uniref:restriction endonuclease n=1 Tax=Streptomyces sp. NPDC046465 TaxID=3155810 RepID=UPI0033D2260C